MNMTPSAGLRAEEIVLNSYDDVRLALNSDSLVRSIDSERYERGNLMENVLLMLVGAEHRDRRRVENALFRRDRLALYEKELFPNIITQTLAAHGSSRADLIELGALLAVVLSAEAAGIDFDRESLEERRRLGSYLRVFARGEAIDAEHGDVEDIKAEVQASLADFDRSYYAASRRRRLDQLARVKTGTLAEADLPADVLTVLLAARERLDLDEATILRETAFFFEAGAHTSTQTFTNALHFVFAWGASDGERWSALGRDLALVQRCVHEALRLRPTNPAIRRRASSDLEIGKRQMRAGDMVILDTAAANRDPGVFGTSADAFDPDREVRAGVGRYGHSFGGGIHACIGRNLAVGLPIRDAAAVSDDHLFGLVPLMVQHLIRAGARPDPTRDPVPDTGTRRWTRWKSYPVLLRQMEHR